MYYTYILRCEDNSLYTGITTDIARRLQEHQQKGTKGAKYTHNHAVTRLELAWACESRSFASKLEYHIKTLSKRQKESLIQDQRLEDFFADKLDIGQYMLAIKN